MAELRCFVIIPFDDRFDGVYEVVRRAVSTALPGERIQCSSLKESKAAGKITDHIVSAIENATLCVADVSGNNPNVMWETGYAMALGKPTILIAERLGRLPFDLKVHQILEYGCADLEPFAAEVAEATRQTLARQRLEPVKAGWAADHAPALTISVTGSYGGDRARTSSRVGQVLRPYLSRRTSWYVGSTGAVDETVLDFLLAHRQQVVVVPYNRYDFSKAVHRRVAAGEVRYLDASLEVLPKGLDGPTARDVLFCMKSDLVVLFWDGASPGTRELAGFFERQGRNVLLSFI